MQNNDHPDYKLACEMHLKTIKTQQAIIAGYQARQQPSNEPAATAASIPSDNQVYLYVDEILRAAGQVPLMHMRPPIVESCIRIMRMAVARLSSSAIQSQPEQAKPTDLSKRLRGIAVDPMFAHHVEVQKVTILAAADEIERYYGGMLAWKQAAEAKDGEFIEYRSLVRAAIVDLFQRMEKSYSAEPTRRITFMDMDAVFAHVKALNLGGCLDGAAVPSHLTATHGETQAKGGA